MKVPHFFILTKCSTKEVTILSPISFPRDEAERRIEKLTRMYSKRGFSFYLKNACKKHEKWNPSRSLPMETVLAYVKRGERQFENCGKCLRKETQKEVSDD